MHPKSNAFSGTPPKLVGALIRRHKRYTKGIAKLYKWQGKLGGKSAENRRALDQMARRGNPNDIRGKGHRNKIKRALEILTINY